MLRESQIGKIFKDAQAKIRQNWDFQFKSK